MYGHGSSDEIFKPKCELLKYQNNLKDFKLLLITELDIAGEAFRPDGGRAAGGSRQDSVRLCLKIDSVNKICIQLNLK